MTYIDIIYIKLGDIVRISKYKNIFANDYTAHWSEVFVKVKNTMPWTYDINDLTEKKLLESFMKKKCKEQIKKSLELKKKSRGKAINYMLNGKDTTMRLLAGQIKKT